MATKALVLAKRVVIGAKRLPLLQLLRHPRLTWSRLLSNATDQLRVANQPLLTAVGRYGNGGNRNDRTNVLSFLSARAQRMLAFLSRPGAVSAGGRRLIPLAALSLGLGLIGDSKVAEIHRRPTFAEESSFAAAGQEAARDRAWEAADRALPRPTGLDELRLLRLVGLGGNSGVLEATSKDAAARLAVKRYFNPSIESTAFSSLNREFDRELRLLSRLSHPGVAKAVSGFVAAFRQAPGDLIDAPAFMPSSLHDDGCGRNATFYMVMPLYDGSLADLLAAQGPIGRAESLAMLAQLAEADAYLKGSVDVAHRDIRSSNVAVRGVGPDRRRLVLIDFGAAVSPAKMPQPHESVVSWGNSHLVPPEVARAEPGPDSVIDYSLADLWAIATLAWELVGLKNPFLSGSRSSRQPYQPQDLPSLADQLGGRADRLLRRLALAADPADRPTSDWVARALRRLQGEEHRRQRRRQLFARLTPEELLEFSAALPMYWLRPLLLLPLV